MSTEAVRICLSCGNEFSGAIEFCPVSALGVLPAGSSLTSLLSRRQGGFGSKRCNLRNFARALKERGYGRKPVR